MDKYKVAKEREVVKSPSSIIVNGKAIFGSFDKPIFDINLLEAKNQSRYLPTFTNCLRLTEWEACEIDFKEATIVMAVYKNMVLNGMGLLVYYDKASRKIYSYRKLGLYRMAHVAKNLYNTESYIQTKNFNLNIKNDFLNNKAFIKASIYNKRNGLLKLDVELNEIAKPSVVSIPLGLNKPLYTQKSIFKASGRVSFMKNEYILEANSLGIIDDHKAFYPYKTHYDWLTSMATINIEGENHSFGFNLTKNQSLNESLYNENNIWLDDKFYYLPPVVFTKLKDKWLINDAYGNVNLEFNIYNSFIMNSNLLIFKIDYSLPFGRISGYLKTQDGYKITLDNVIGIAEDKTTRL